MLERLRASASWARARAGPELRWWLVCAGVLATGWAFAELASEVSEGSTHGLDQAVLRALRDPADPSLLRGPAWLANVARDVTSLGSWPVLLLLSLAVIGYLLLVRAWGAAVLVVAALAGAGLFSQLLKDVFQRPRPDLVPHLDEVVTYSFPSGHSMLAASVYLTLGLLLARLLARRRLKLYVFGVAIAATGLVGLSRVFVGVHYPTDVLAGWLGGLLWAGLCWLVALVLQRRGTICEEVDEERLERPAERPRERAAV